MDTTTSVVGTTVVVAFGQWAEKDKGPSIKIVVGGTLLVVMMSAIAASNEKFAEQLSLLLLVGSLLRYAIPITKKLGFGKK